LRRYIFCVTEKNRQNTPPLPDWSAAVFWRKNRKKGEGNCEGKKRKDIRYGKFEVIRIKPKRVRKKVNFGLWWERENIV
jgi:hypothetical protein